MTTEIIGQHQITLGANEFITGMASSMYTNDGALSPATSGVNPFVVPGVLYGLAAGVDISTNVAGNLIASCQDSSSALPLARYMVDDVANLYDDNGTGITKLKTGTASYVSGITDMESFDGKFWITNTTNLSKWDGSTTLSESYIGAGFTFNNVNHPLQKYINSLYVADGNTFWIVPSNGSGTGVAIASALTTLLPNEYIIATNIDPGTGLMIISTYSIREGMTSPYVNDATTAQYWILLWDGVSATVTRRIPVHDMVTAFHNLEGQLYAGQGQTLGLWNGSGITFLRKLNNVALKNTDLLYKHHFANTGRILHIVDGQSILSYGAVIAGKKAFFYTASPLSGSNHLSIVYPRGNNKIVIGYATNKAVSFDFSDSTSATSLANVAFNNIYFPRQIFVRKMRVLTTGIPHSGLTDLTISIGNEKGGVVPIANTSRIISVPSGQTYYVIDFDYGGGIAQGIEPILALTNNNYGIVRVYTYYDIRT